MEGEENKNILPDESRQEKHTKKKKDKKSKLLLIIIMFLLFTIFAGGVFVYNKYIKDTTPDITDDIGASDDQVVKDYTFDKDGNPIAVKPPNIGMAIKSAVLGDVDGKATMMIKNSGDINIEPKIVFKDKVIYQSPLLKPGEAVEAKLEFGPLAVGEHEFNVLAMYQGGSGLSLKSKVVVFKPGTEVKIKED